MDDRIIIDLLFERSEQGLKELMEKYGHAILHTTRNFLKNEQDALECSNDTYMALWNSIPPARPESLPAYIHSTARNLALRRYHANTAQCRSSGYDTALDELSECLAGRDTAETIVEAQELREYINRFLAGLKEEDRRLFLRRYWFEPGRRMDRRLLGAHQHRSRRLLGAVADARQKRAEYPVVKKQYSLSSQTP